VSPVRSWPTAPSQRTMMAAVFNLNHPAHTVHWHFLTMTVSNVVVIVLMLVVFVVAVVAPFPGRGGKGRAG
jgi:Flp pilus assembly protein protease CpaA